jgi:hypothetical protein
MKRITILLIILLCSIQFVLSQKVDSIKVEQTGDLIKINYKILNSTPDQVFRITVFCSINGGLESRLKSLSGDFGDNVAGGRENYMVLWDVLKDVDEVKTVDFSIKAELVQGNPSKQGPEKIRKKRTYLMAAGLVGPLRTQVGYRLSFMGNWGLSYSGLFGNNKFSTGEDTYEGFTIIADITKRIVNTKDLQLHLLTGLAVANTEVNQTGVYQDKFLYGFDLGLAAGFKRFSLHTGFSTARWPTIKTTVQADPTSWFNIGAGIRF